MTMTAKETKRQLIIAVGSKNPVKVNSVKRAFTSAFSGCDIECVGFDVNSGVPDQPWGDSETRRGAINRAQACNAAYVAAFASSPAFAVGLEGGVVDESLDIDGVAPFVSCFAFMAVLRKQQWGIARSASFPLPPKLVSLMRGANGQPPMELGDADDAVFGEVNSKQKGGTIAKATCGLIDRTEYYYHTLLCAVVPFLHDDTKLYD